MNKNKQMLWPNEAIDHLTPESVIASEKFTRIARNEQDKRDTGGIFWAILVGFVFGVLFAVSYAVHHHQ